MIIFLLFFINSIVNASDYVIKNTVAEYSKLTSFSEMSSRMDQEDADFIKKYIVKHKLQGALPKIELKNERLVLDLKGQKIQFGITFEDDKLLISSKTKQFTISSVNNLKDNVSNFEKMRAINEVSALGFFIEKANANIFLYGLALAGGYFAGEVYASYKDSRKKLVDEEPSCSNFDVYALFCSQKKYQPKFLERQRNLQAQVYEKIASISESDLNDCLNRKPKSGQYIIINRNFTKETRDTLLKCKKIVENESTQNAPEASRSVNSQGI